MAKPVKETPILTKRDEVDFFKKMNEVKIKGSPKSPLDKKLDAMLKTGSF
jgi:hypothetical protein